MANSFIGNYAPDSFTIILSKGSFVHKVTGFADGSFVSMDRITPTSVPYQGVGDNSFARVKRNVTAMNVTVTLHQYSPSNTVLQQLQLADASVPGNDWVFNCVMKDLSGQTVASSSNAIIEAPANATFSNATETRQWKIYMFGSDLFIGGNMLMDAADVAAMDALGGTVDPRWTIAGQ